MKEGDAAVADAGPWLGVDQLDPGGGDSHQGGVDVLDRVGDVVQPLALRARNLPTAVSGPSGASGST